MQWNEFRSHIGHFSAREQLRVEKAFELGKKVHDGQKRMSGEPYFSHPVAVADMLADAGADADTVIAALLHDTIEDTPLTIQDIDADFDGSVGPLIEGVTKLTSTDVEGQPNLDEQIETLRKIFTLMEKDIRIMVIKIIDRLHNMQTVEFLPPKKQQLLAKETLDIYVKIADRLCMQDRRDELELLCMKILEPDVAVRLEALRLENEQLGQSLLTDLREHLQSHFPEHSSDVRMQYEHKSWDTLRGQLLTEGTAVTGISGISIAFICESVETCYRVLGALHQVWQREAMSFEDFINVPAINGYRGLHTTVITEDGTRVRCKIRTPAMHDYARKGIVLHCFSGKSFGLLEHLPWMARISPLTQDTEGRSTEFWRTLQSDILGESILIYGPANQQVIVPKGASVLDGAFYLFNTEALKTTSISIGGKNMPFSTPLGHAYSLNVTMADQPTVERKWLSWTKTGFATSFIRSALSAGKTESEKIILGKELVQRVLTEKRKGFLEEFDEGKLEAEVQYLGLGSLSEVFIKIADGHLDPDEVYREIFDHSTRALNEKIQRCIIRYLIDVDNIDLIDRLHAAHKKYSLSLDDIRYSKMRKLPGSTQVVLHAHLSPEDQNSFKQELNAAGAESIEIIIRSPREISILAAVIFLWALNPVFAQWLLTHGMRITSLITLRFLTFSLFTTILFIFWRIFTKTKFKSIDQLSRITALPTIGNAALTFFTYITLLFIPPSVHLSILRLNTLFPSVVSRKTDYKNFLLLLLLLLLGGGGALFLVTLGERLLGGLLFSLTTLVSFTLYSLSTEHVLHEYRIDLRSQYFLFHSGLLLGIFGIALLLIFPNLDLWSPLSAFTVLYVLLCVCIPHSLYSVLLKTTRFKYFTDFQLLEVPIAMVLEVLLLGTVLHPMLYVGIGVSLILLLAYRWEKLIR